MRRLPATYLDLRAEFVRRRISFQNITDAVNRDHGKDTSVQYVRNTLRMYWGRKDLEAAGDVAPFIMAKAKELIIAARNGHAAGTQDTPAQRAEKPDESGAESSQPSDGVL